MNTIPEVHIFSDWGANPNPGPGAYGVIMEYRWVKKEFSGGYKKTTNNRMELTGVITGLSKLKTRSKVTIFTDSQYTINGIEKWWAVKWRANNWKKADKKTATNHDLWWKLLDLTQKHDVSFYWIKGHNGHIENERCDELATLAMKKKNLWVDTWFIENPEKLKLSIEQVVIDIDAEKTWTQCKKCDNDLIVKYPKHSKKTLEKEYYYEYYHPCPACKTNYMLEEAKREISTLKL